MNLRQLCVPEGFHGRNGIYLRIVGDGVLQCVYQTVSCYIHQLSPEYSIAKPKAKCIHLSFHSMYSNLPEDLFSGEYRFGLIYPENFLGHRCIEFCGPEYELQIMQDYGLPRLNQMLTQEQMINEYLALAKIQFCGDVPYDIDLNAAYLKCGKKWEALDRACSSFGNRWILRIKLELDQLTSIQETNSIQISISKKSVVETKQLVDFWEMIVGYDEEKIQEYLQTNFDRNMRFAQKYHIL